MEKVSRKEVNEMEEMGVEIEAKGRQRTEYIADFPDLVDIVADGKEIKFLTFDGEVSSFAILQDRKYYCPQRDQFPPYMQIARLDEVLKYARNHKLTDDTDVSGIPTPPTNNCPECLNLYNKLYQLHQSISEMPDPGFYHILTLWDFHTHSVDRAEYSPIIYFYSVAERGKTRTIKGMLGVARRGIRKGDIKDAQLIRDCTDLRASLGFDMTDFWESVKTAGSQDVILNRYEQGLTVSRINRPDKGKFRDTDFYDVFGPTLLATNEIIADIADTRSIPITMIKSERDFEDEVKRNDLLPYMEQLAAWRMAHGKEKWEQPNKLVRSRLGDIIRPLHQILIHVAPDYQAAFAEIIEKVKQTKLTEKSNSLTAEVLLSISKTIKDGNLVNGVFASQLVTNSVNEGKDEREKFKSRRIGSIIKSLGFKPTVTATGALGFLYRETLLTRLLGEYGVLVPGVTETSETSVTPSQQTSTDDNKLDQISIEEIE